MGIGKLVTASNSRTAGAAVAQASLRIGEAFLLKTVQGKGKYPFSASAILALSEVIKFGIATTTFYREWKARNIDESLKKLDMLINSGRIDYHSEDEDAQPLETVGLELGEVPRIHDDEEGLGDDVTLHDEEADQENGKTPGVTLLEIPPIPMSDCGSRRSSMQYSIWGSDDDTWEPPEGQEGIRTSFLQCCLEQIREPGRHKLVWLALLNALANHLLLATYLVADPGTVHLFKSIGDLAPVVIKLLVLIFFSATADSMLNFSGLVYLVPFLHSFALAISQLKTAGAVKNSTSIYPWPTYFILVADILLNSLIRRRQPEGSNADAMVLSASGTATNILLHISAWRFGKDHATPGFLSGVGRLETLGIITHVSLSGYLVPFLSQYTNSPAPKLFIYVIPTATLLYISPKLWSAHYGPFIIYGAVVTFVATYLYLSSSANRENSGTSSRRSGIAKTSVAMSTRRFIRKLSQRAAASPLLSNFVQHHRGRSLDKPRSRLKSLEDYSWCLRLAFGVCLTVVAVQGLQGYVDRIVFE